MRRVATAGLFALWIGLAIWGWRHSFRETSAEVYAVKSANAAEALYVPSPIEAKLLAIEGGPWPRQFNSARPPSPDRVPELYSEAESSGLASAITSPAAWRKARAWSIAANSNDLTRLEQELTTLPDPERRLSARGATCALDEQEALFRWQQVKPIWRRDFAAYLDRCGGSPVVAGLVRLGKAIEEKDRAALETLESDFTQRGHVPDKTWESWMASEAARAARLALGSI